MFSIMATLAIAAGQGTLKSTELDYTVHDFHFADGEILPEVRLHCTTLGTPMKDANGHVRNAVLIMHGTSGTGQQFFNPVFAGVLFGPGQLLDISKYYIILPDALGHGKSSKPSNGLHARFPHYGYHDIVTLQHELITNGLHVDHLRIVMGTSMGGMQTWMWGEMYPDMMDALMPLASLPVQIAGRNRMTRKMIIDDIQGDPGYNGGEYTTQPHGLKAARDIEIILGSSALQLMKLAPTRDQADTLLARMERTNADANDMLYYWAASGDYDPSPDLEKIKAPLIAVNFADDVINPPELKIGEKEIKRVKRGKFIVMPITDQTRGHGTHTVAKVWQQYLAELLRERR